MSAPVISVFLVDDHQVLRDGLRVLINGEKDMTVVGEASKGKTALQRLKDKPCDIVVLDLGLPDIGGIEVIKRIRKLGLPCKIIVLSMHSDSELISMIYKKGGDGFVPKSTACEYLLDAIQAVHSGKKYIHPEAGVEIISSATKEYKAKIMLNELSERELEVFTLSVLGYTRSEISEKLNISSATVDTYRVRANRKLGLDTRSEMIEFAIQAGIMVKNEPT